MSNIHDTIDQMTEAEARSFAHGNISILATLYYWKIDLFRIIETALENSSKASRPDDVKFACDTIITDFARIAREASERN